MRDVNTMKDLKIKLILIILAAVLASGSYLYILHVGKEYHYVNNAFRSDNELKIVDIISDDGGEIEILGFQQTEKGYTADLRAKTPGHVFVYVSGDEGVGSSFFLTVHKNLLTKINSLLAGFCFETTRHGKQTGIKSGLCFSRKYLCCLVNLHHSCVVNAQELVQASYFGLFLAFAFSFFFQDVVVYGAIFGCLVALKHSHNLIASLTQSR